MGVIELGTRVSNNNALTVGTSTRTYSASYSADQGLALNVSGAFVFDPAAGKVTLAGAFGAFMANIPVLISNTVSNNGLFYVTAVSANALTLAPPPKAENAPANAKIRVA